MSSPASQTSAETTLPRVAVIGAGALGELLAGRVALAGYEVVLEDLLPSSLRRAQGGIEAGLADHAESRQALARLRYASSLHEAVSNAGLIIEALPDEMESKLEILTTLDKMAPPQTVIAITGERLSISELAEFTYRAGRCFGLQMTREASPSLQITRAEQTSSSTWEMARTLAARLQLPVREIPDRPYAP